MKIALLGCGGMARIHAASLKQAGLDATQIVAVSRSLATAREFADSLGLKEAMETYQAALDDKDIEAVFILTPHDQHVELTVEALRKGKHVFLEKPVTRTVAEAEPIARTMAEYPSRVLMVGENVHYVPAVLEARAALDRGEIGELQSVIVNGLFRVQPGGWRAEAEPMGGGALIDGGVHAIHALRLLAGEVSSVCAASPAVKWNTMEGEESVQMMMRMVSGVTATMNYSWSNHGDPSLPDVLLMGTDGSLAVHMREKANVLYKCCQKPRPLPTEGRWGKADLFRRLGHPQTDAAFLECANEGRAPSMTLAEGLRDVAVVEAAYRSTASGAVEPVEALPDWIVEAG